MKELVLGCIAFAALAAADPAVAADLTAKPVYKAPAAVAPPASSWTGFYVGGNLGWGWDDPRAVQSDTIEAAFAGGPNFFVPSTVSGKSNSLLGGAHIGYNWQFAPTWVAGVEADWDFAHFSKSGTVGPLPVNFPNFGLSPTDPGTSFSAQTRVTDPWSIRGRLGYSPQPVWMIYATGGFAQVGLKLNGNTSCAPLACILAAAQAPATVSATRSGWVAGAGVEYMQPGSPWIVGFEYLYYGFDGSNIANAAFVPAGAGGSCAAGQACLHYAVGDFNVQSIRFRLSYKFN